MQQVEIRSNKYYTIKVSPKKNRAYLKIIGYWRNVSIVPDYLDDWNKALSYLKSGFTLLTDASEMKIHPPDVKSLHEQAQLLVKNKNVVKVAEIISDDVATFQLDAVAKLTKFPKQNFRSYEEAEKWLDEPLS